MINKPSHLLSWIKKNIFWLIMLLLVSIVFYFKNILSYINTQVSIMSNKSYKVVVFDLDETIGSFGELMVLWNCLELIKDKYRGI